MQVDVAIVVIGTNDHSPMFDFSIYRADLQEFNSITMTSAVSSGQVVTTVHATDRDGTDTAAGRLEYRITNGAMQFGEEMFRIDRTVSPALLLYRACSVSSAHSVQSLY